MSDSHARDEQKSFAEERDSLWRLVLAPLIWIAHFVLTYAATSLICVKLVRHGVDVVHLRIGIAVITALALGGIVGVGWRSWRRWDYLDDYDYVHDEAIEEDRHEFLGHAAFLLAIISFVGVVYVALPAVFIRSCA